MRFWSIVACSLVAASAEGGESTALLQLPRVMREALGPRNYDVHVPAFRPVAADALDAVPAEEDAEVSPLQRVREKLNQIPHRRPHANAALAVETTIVAQEASQHIAHGQWNLYKLDGVPVADVIEQQGGTSGDDVRVATIESQHSDPVETHAAFRKRRHFTLDAQ